MANSIQIATILTLLCVAVVLAQEKGTFTDPRDNKTYKTIKINQTWVGKVGNQTWLAENLNYDANGSKCYENKESNCQKYGRLYNWNTAKSACPKGWHLPSAVEWQILVNIAGGNYTAGKKLKATSGWGKNDNGKSANGTDAIGFSALPGGYSLPNGDFINGDDFGTWWTANEYYVSNAYIKYMSYNNDSVNSYHYDKNHLFSVRCLHLGNSDNAEPEIGKPQAINKDADNNSSNQKIEDIKKDSFIDTRDNKEYKTVVIGTQTWMAENLNYDADGSKCYNNNPDLCQKYGKLYNWNAALEACPSGWHLPDKREWNILTASIGGEDKWGKLKDPSGFFALPGGLGTGNTFKDAGNYGSWWSSSEVNSDYAYNRYMIGVKYEGHGSSKSLLYSVRCVQDFSSNGEVEARVKAADVQSGSFKDRRDNKTYKTVKIGEQTWMAENLNYNANGSKCYENKPANCKKYGKLYNWKTALKACPSGWHLPDTTDWNVLTTTIGGKEMGGKFLKATSGWDWDTWNGVSGDGTDDYGFSALPGGYCLWSGDFCNVGLSGVWWTSNERNGCGNGKESCAYKRIMNNSSTSTDDVVSSYDYKSALLSVRCLQN